MICFETDELPVLHPYVHRQGSGRGAARAAAAAARQRARRFPGGRDDTAAGEEDTFTIDRTPRRSLATAGTGGGLLLPFELEVTTVIAGSSRGFSVRLYAKVTRLYFKYLYLDQREFSI